MQTVSSRFSGSALQLGCFAEHSFLASKSRHLARFCVRTRAGPQSLVFRRCQITVFLEDHANVTKVFCAVSLGLILFACTARTQADLVLSVDLSVVNQVTILSVPGASANTVSGSDVTGFYLDNFYNGPTPAIAGDALVTGNLTSFLNGSDTSPDLYHIANDPGMNVWSYTNDITSDFVAGTQAFSGSATWNVTPIDYANMLAGNLFGEVFFPADDVTDVAGGIAPFIGTWVVKVPEPTSLALVCLGAIPMIGRRGRRS